MPSEGKGLPVKKPNVKALAGKQAKVKKITYKGGAIKKNTPQSRSRKMASAYGSWSKGGH
tara:strand:- start:83 stop:262 length:180 start_codon:yes stop_codon:yes gene_type:complete